MKEQNVIEAKLTELEEALQYKNKYTVDNNVREITELLCLIRALKWVLDKKKKIY